MKTPIKLDIETGTEWLLPAAKRWLEQAKKAMRTQLGAKVFDLPTGEKVTINWRPEQEYIRIKGQGRCAGYTTWGSPAHHIKFYLEPSDTGYTDSDAVYVEDGGGSAVSLPDTGSIVFIPDVPALMFFSGDDVVMLRSGTVNIGGADVTRVVAARKSMAILRGIASGSVSKYPDHYAPGLLEVDFVSVYNPNQFTYPNLTSPSYANINRITAASFLSGTAESYTLNGHDGFQVTQPGEKLHVIGYKFDGLANDGSGGLLRWGRGFSFYDGAVQVFEAPVGSWSGFGVSGIIGYKQDIPAATYMDGYYLYTLSGVGEITLSAAHINLIDWATTLSGSSSTSISDPALNAHLLTHITDTGDAVYYTLSGYVAEFVDGVNLPLAGFVTSTDTVAHMALSAAEVESGLPGYYYIKNFSSSVEYPQTATNIQTAEQFLIQAPELCGHPEFSSAATNPIGIRRMHYA